MHFLSNKLCDGTRREMVWQDREEGRAPDWTGGQQENNEVRRCDKVVSVSEADSEGRSKGDWIQRQQQGERNDKERRCCTRSIRSLDRHELVLDGIVCAGLSAIHPRLGPQRALVLHVAPEQVLHVRVAARPRMQRARPLADRPARQRSGDEGRRAALARVVRGRGAAARGRSGLRGERGGRRGWGRDAVRCAQSRHGQVSCRFVGAQTRARRSLRRDGRGALFRHDRGRRRDVVG